MSEPRYQGFWGMKTGDTLLAIANFLTWKKEDWVSFERVLDELEKNNKKVKRGRVKRYSLRQRLKDLLKRGAVVEKRVGDKVLLCLSDEGWRCARARQIRRVVADCRNGFVIVTFDVPEKRRRERNLLRRFLKQSGFEQLHRSVWAHRRDVAPLVAEVVSDLKLRPWVTVIEGKLIISDFS